MDRVLRLSAAAALLVVALGAGAARAAGDERAAVALQPLRAAHLWEGAGVLTADAGRFTSARAGLLAANRFRWVAIQLANGLARNRHNVAALQRGWAEGFRARGIRVCGWGANGRRPVREAALVARFVTRYRLDCYIADAETPYMGGDYGGDPRRSAAFVAAFRKRLPTLPAALTTMGGATGPWVYPFDYTSWRLRGFALLPQAYLSISTAYCPSCTVDHAARAGYPRARVHPMVGVGWSQDRGKRSGAEYAWRLARAGTVGFSVFLGETSSDADFRALGAAIRSRRIAR